MKGKEAALLLLLQLLKSQLALKCVGKELELATCRCRDQAQLECWFCNNVSLVSTL